MLTLSMVFGLSLAGPAFSADGQRAEAEPSDRVTGENCRGVFAFPDADPDTVRELGRIPKDWKLQGVEQQGDRATLAVFMLSCEHVNVAGRARTLIYSALAVYIDPPERVSHRSTSSFGGIPGETDFYLISWLTNDSDFAQWTEEDTGLHQLVHYVPGLEFTYDANLGAAAEFTFKAGPPTPSPFEASALVIEPAAPTYPLVANFWAETSEGAVMIETSHPPPGARLGSSQWELHAEPNSPLARMLGRDEATGFNEIGSEFGLLGEWRKDLPSDCTPETRAEQLRNAQNEVLGLLRPAPGLDLTTLRNSQDLAALAALGYDVYGHQQVSFGGMGWGVVDGLPRQDPNEAKPLPGRPTALLYAPTVPLPPLTVTDPRDGFDFPYRLAGWLYNFPFKFEQHPTLGGDGRAFLPCVEREEWFVHERGLHPFSTGGMEVRPPAEENHGTAPGGSGTEPLPESAGDIPHGRLWALHVWLNEEGVPTVSLLSPEGIPGLDPGIGVSPPLSWPNPPYPAFYYPRRVADLSLAMADLPGRVATGRDLTYTLAVINNGPTAASEVEVTDTLPAGVTFVSATPSQGSCNESSGTVICSLETMRRGSSATIDLVVKPRSAGTITNRASVASALPDLLPADNSDTEETSVCRTTSRKSSIPCP